MDEGFSCHPPLIPSSLHQLSQLTFQRPIVLQPSTSSLALMYSAECVFFFFLFVDLTEAGKKKSRSELRAKKVTTADEGGMRETFK